MNKCSSQTLSIVMGVKMTWVSVDMNKLAHKAQVCFTAALSKTLPTGQVPRSTG